MIELKSINNKDVFGKPETGDIGNPAYYVSGIVDSVFTHETKYGENVGLKGDFVAVNAKTGNKFKAGAAFLPNEITAQIKERVMSGEIEIEFQCCIKLMETDKNPSGYTWIVEAPKTKERQAKANALMDKLGELPLAIENKKSDNKKA